MRISDWSSDVCSSDLPDTLARQFEALGFVVSHKHPAEDVVRYKQGRITLLLNRETAGQAANFRSLHGPSASSLAFRVADPKSAYDQAIQGGTTPVDAGVGILADDESSIEGIVGTYPYWVKMGDGICAHWHEVPRWGWAEGGKTQRA